MAERIALGLGDNVDYEIVWDTRVIEDLIVRHAIQAHELTAGTVIRNERELVLSILSFVRSGSGGERTVASSAMIEEFAGKFAKNVSLGGTSVRAAIAMRKLGYSSALHLVTINDHVRRLIPPDSPYVCSNTQDSLYPHLIVQFDEGTRVRAGDIDLCATRPNRIIYHNDVDNIVMKLNEDFAGLMAGAKVFLISGFNAMQSEDLLAARLATLSKMMDDLPDDAIVFFEDAAFYNPDFCRLIHTTLADRISIYSLNEDELEGHLGRKIDVLDARQVRDALADLHALIPVPMIVVHSMYWALAYGNGAAQVGPALKGGVTMATTRFQYGDDFVEQHYRETEHLPPNQDGARFAAEIGALLGGRVCCVPVARVEQSNATTVGLGDAFVGGFLPALLG